MSNYNRHNNYNGYNNQNNNGYNNKYNNSYNNGNSGKIKKSVNPHATFSLSLVDNLSDISFCDKQCSNLNNNKAKEELINFVQNKFKIEIIKKSYVVLNPHMMRNISYHQHILSTLTNGNIYLLFLTKIDGINCCFFIDRKLKNGYSYPKIHCVKYRFDDSLYENGTILNGELIRDQNRDWFFIISDILIYKGKSMKDKNILSRFNLLHSILKNEYKQDLDLEI